MTRVCAYLKGVLSNEVQGLSDFFFYPSRAKSSSSFTAYDDNIVKEATVMSPSVSVFKNRLENQLSITFPEMTV